MSLILTFGLDMVLRNLHIHFFDGEVDPRSVSTSYSSKSFEIGLGSTSHTRGSQCSSSRCS